MSKVKDVSFIAGPVRATFPNGSRILFENGKEYLLYLNLHFGDGYSVIIMDDEENLKPSAATYDLNELVLTKSPQETTVSTTNNIYDPNGVDKELGQLVLTLPTLTPPRYLPIVVNPKPLSFLNRVGQFINDEIFLNKDNIRAKNYVSAENRNPNFSRDWDMASNIAEGLNVMSGGFLNRLSPTQNIGLVIDAVLGDNIMLSWFGNSGIVSDNFELNHPYLTFGINALGDFGVYQVPRTINPILRTVDRLGTKSLMNQEIPNTLNRLIGTGTSGYEDALRSGIIRGNPNIGVNAHDLKRLLKVLKYYEVPEETIRNYASNNISEKEFYQLKEIFDSHYGKAKNFWSRSSPFGDLETYLDYLDDIKPITEPMYSKNPSDWSYSWNGHKMATFAEPGETLWNNASLFPGDFGVLITNSPLYRQSSTLFGHFALHPTTKYPMPIENPDVNIFVRKDGWLTGTKYMSKVPKNRVLNDQVRLLKGLPVNTTPRIITNPLFQGDIPVFYPFRPVIPNFVLDNRKDRRNE